MRTRDMHPWVAYDDATGTYAYATFTYDTALATGTADSYEEARYLALVPIVKVTVMGTSRIPEACKEDAVAYATMKLWQDVQQDAMLMHQQDSFILWRAAQYARNSVAISLHGRRIHRAENQPNIIPGAVLDNSDDFGGMKEEGIAIFNLGSIEDETIEPLIRECEQFEFRTYLLSLTKAERAVAHGLIRGDEKKSIASALAVYEPQYTEASRRQRISMHIRSLKAKWLQFVGMSEEEFLSSELSPI